MKKNFEYLVVCLLAILTSFITACNQAGESSAVMRFTCPMPSDSFFSAEPGTCPKCGMTLIPIDSAETASLATDTTLALKVSAYHCPMHPQIIRDDPGSCPICGMALEPLTKDGEPLPVSLQTLLKPANNIIIATVAMVHPAKRQEPIELKAYGFIGYDNRYSGVIASNISGRIEQLYVDYRYQSVHKGQLIMKLYSPELLTAQQDLLFLTSNDPTNNILIQSAKEKLRLMGMRRSDIEKVMANGKANYAVPIYSNYSGHIHESKQLPATGSLDNINPQEQLQSTPLSIKVGDYVQKGQPVFTVMDPAHAWALLNIFPGQAALIQKGDKVRIQPETAPDKDFRGSINYIEPFYRDEQKSLSARVYFDNSSRDIPIGSQLTAVIFAGEKEAYWLPEEAVLSLGLDKIVFVKTGEAFKARKIKIGVSNNKLVQVLDGLDETEAVAANAQFLVDSESFIKTN